jgi:PleD family two-component response regulator
VLDKNASGIGQKKKIIMAVDDSTETLLLISIILRDDFDVRLCNGSNVAFSMLERYKPDLILLDVEMPEMNGFEFMEKFKKKYPYSDVPVIFVTSHRTEDAVTLAARAGAKGYVGKPFTSDILRSKVFEALKD